MPMMMDKKKIAALIVEKMPSKSGQKIADKANDLRDTIESEVKPNLDSKVESTGLSQAADDIMSSISSKSGSRLMEALKSFIDLYTFEQEDMKSMEESNTREM